MHRIDPRIVIVQIVLSGICAFWIFKPLISNVKGDHYNGNLAQ